MARYIDAERIPFYIRDVGDRVSEYDIRKIAFASEIENMPAADVVPKSYLEMSEHLLKRAYESIEQKDKLLETIKADTVRKMQERIEEHYSAHRYQPTAQKPIKHTQVDYMLAIIDQIAKELMNEQV